MWSRVLPPSTAIFWNIIRQEEAFSLRPIVRKNNNKTKQKTDRKIKTITKQKTIAQRCPRPPKSYHNCRQTIHWSPTSCVDFWSSLIDFCSIWRQFLVGLLIVIRYHSSEENRLMQINGLHVQKKRNKWFTCAIKRTTFKTIKTKQWKAHYFAMKSGSRC